MLIIKSFSVTYLTAMMRVLIAASNLERDSMLLLRVAKIVASELEIKKPAPSLFKSSF